MPRLIRCFRCSDVDGVIAGWGGGDEAKGWGRVNNLLGKPILKFVLQFVSVGIQIITIMLGCILYNINLNF